MHICSTCGCYMIEFINSQCIICYWNSIGPQEIPMPLDLGSKTVANEFGGKQSEVKHAMHLMPPEALLRIAAILYVGATKYGEWNWRQITREEHLNHAIIHLYAHLAGDTSEDHLGNAGCRILFALDPHLVQKEADHGLGTVDGSRGASDVRISTDEVLDPGCAVR